MQQGKCRLCLEEKQLIRSHLLPRSVYDYFRAAGSDPIILSEKLIIQSSRQLQDYLLCAECDNLLSKRGESWVLPLLAKIDGTFPLSDIIHEQAPDIDEPDVRVYLASKNPKIDINKLAHFGLGIFWKASVHSWRGDRTEPLINLGRYGEPLRLYIKGQGPFPKEMSLTVGVLPQPVKLISANLPYRGSAEGHHNYLCYVSGLYYGLQVGRGISTEIKRGCFVANPGHPILEAEFEQAIKTVTREVTAKAHIHKKVREYVE